ncbi:MAG: poly-beta-1,6-N-acetyl-D-glucosamine N-deacetylase PgaB [Synechococcaceae cyanobacterium]
MGTARSNAPAAAADPDRQLLVLAYHEIAEPGQAISPDYAVSPSALATQLGWLQEHGYHFISIEQLLAARAGKAPLPQRPVLLSFDDGYASVYSQAFPLLKRFQAPALVAVVGHWLEPEPGKVSFGEGLIDRQKLLSWAQLREMQQSGLVEVASHSFDLHHGINGNPQGNQMPAATTRAYTAQHGYESEASYRQRLRDDLGRSVSQIQQQLGRRPRVIVWPYGRYNAIAESVAREQGLAIGLNLDDGANTPSVPLGALRRVLMTAEMGPLTGLRQELIARRRNVGDTSRSASVMHVDLDYIDDPDPAQVERNLQLLLSRIRAMGVNTVFLQAYADPDGNGAANAVYFPNRFLPVKRDLFSHVAWEIPTRTQVRRLYAWMPVLAFELPRGVAGADQKVITQPSRRGVLSMGYPRLSPFAPAAMATVRGIDADLARSARFDGLLFHDDVTLTDYEDASAAALRQYKAWGLPTDLAAIRSSDALMGLWTNRKVAALEQLTLDLASVVRAEQPQLSTARNLYAQVVLNPHAESWYAQAFDAALRDYDFTAVMAMPQMEQAKDADAFLGQLVDKVKEQPRGLERTLFELQSTDWNTHKDIPSPVLAAQLRRLHALGVRHAGYYPDNLHRDTPDPAILRPAFQQLGSSGQHS